MNHLSGVLKVKCVLDTSSTKRALNYHQLLEINVSFDSVLIRGWRVRWGFVAIYHEMSISKTFFALCLFPTRRRRRLYRTVNSCWQTWGGVAPPSLPWSYDATPPTDPSHWSPSVTGRHLRWSFLIVSCCQTGHCQMFLFSFASKLLCLCFISFDHVGFSVERGEVNPEIKLRHRELGRYLHWRGKKNIPRSLLPDPSTWSRGHWQSGPVSNARLYDYAAMTNNARIYQWYCSCFYPPLCLTPNSLGWVANWQTSRRGEPLWQHPWRITNQTSPGPYNQVIV